MKTKIKSSLLLGILTLGTIIGFLALSVGIASATEIITVEPSGGDDTANIQAAFNAAGPGDTVQLTAGQFYTNEIFVTDFVGTFKGAGKGATKIDVLRGLDESLEGVSIDYLTKSTHLFTFFGGDVHISDLIFDITPYEPANVWGPDPPGDPPVVWYDLLSVILITGDLNSRIENIKFTGHEGTAVYDDPEHPLFSEKTYNVRVGVEYGGGPPTTGSHIITDCEFNSLWLGITAWGLMNCELSIMSNSIQGGAIGIINVANINSKFKISGNEIEANFKASIWVMKFIPSPCQWLITRNTLRPSIWADGIMLEDYTGSGAFEAVVSHNKITLDDTIWGGIWTLMLQDAYISNNIIRGTGAYGIECDFSINNLLLGNNVQNVDAFWFPIILYKSSNCVIVGGSTKTSVADFAGSNNIIVGMNNMQGNSPGQEIQEAMELKRELIQSFY